MNVMISDLEAKAIAKATGQRYAALSESRTHDLGKFTGSPCPFLKDSVCSIYAHRPFVCRKHLSFHTSDYWCKPERSHMRELPEVKFSAAEEAYFDVTGLKTRGVFADIRDFFSGPASS